MTSRRPSRGRALLKTALGLAAALLGLSTAGVAHAEGDTPPPDALRTKSTRRSDFTLGASAGLAFGRASGYPNKVQEIGDPAYHSTTKLGLGSGQLIWLGVAFNDYLTFGLGFGGFNLSGNDRSATASVFGFHVDAYPLFAVDKNLQDLGVFTNFGTGPLKITGAPKEADGGLMSYVEAGIVYERLRLWRVGLGPSVSLIHVWSESAEATTALVGARVAFYGGP